MAPARGWAVESSPVPAVADGSGRVGMTVVIDEEDFCGRTLMLVEAWLSNLSYTDGLPPMREGLRLETRYLGREFEAKARAVKEEDIVYRLDDEWVIWK